MTIPWWHPVLGEEEARAVREVLGSGFPNDGEVTERFAAAIAALVGRTYGIGVSSGSAAIYCALVACGVEPGDEVVVPDLTFVATANAVRLAGAEPVLVDISRGDFSLHPDAVTDALTPRTRAIVPVHVNGRGGSIAEIVALAERHGLTVVEDAAEALGSQRHGRPLGSFGTAAAFSFAPTKIVTTGQGGVVVTDDPDVARRIRELKDQGRAERGTGGADEHPVFGFNFKLTNLHAAVGLVQLDRLDERLAHLRTLEDWYADELRGIEHDVALVGGDREGGEQHGWVDVVARERDALAEHLRRRGADPREFWFPLHTQPPFAAPAELFPNATHVSARGLWLPSALSLTREHVATVGAAVREFVQTPRAAALS
jgi:dTDP-4-amino-4,6-dideoxygalactose transaminase